MTTVVLATNIAKPGPAEEGEQISSGPDAAGSIRSWRRHRLRAEVGGPWIVVWAMITASSGNRDHRAGLPWPAGAGDGALGGNDGREVAVGLRCQRLSVGARPAVELSKPRTGSRICSPMISEPPWQIFPAPLR